MSEKNKYAGREEVVAVMRMGGAVHSSDRFAPRLIGRDGLLIARVRRPTWHRVIVELGRTNLDVFPRGIGQFATTLKSGGAP